MSSLQTLPSSCPAQEAAIVTTFAGPDATLGPSYLGVVVSSLVYGIACCQACCYVQSERAKRDHWILKSSVALLMLVVTSQQAFIIHGLYYYLVKNFANPCTFLQQVIWSLPADIALNVPTKIVVEGFMVYRTWHLGHNTYVSGICALLTLVASVMDIVYSVQLLSITTLFGVFTKLRGIGLAALALFAFADMCTSATVVFLLYRSRTGFRKSDSLVTKLMLFTISTNIFTTIVTVANVVAYIVGTHGFYATFFSLFLDKLYLNGMLAALNLRNSLNDSLAEAPNEVNSFHSSQSPCNPLP